MTEQFTADTWPIAASTLSFSGSLAGGRVPHEADASHWLAVFEEVAEAGFDQVDLTDSWLRVGDIAPARYDELRAAAAQTNVELASISAIRQSVIHGQRGLENLAYSHRTIDAAAALGIETVSVGLHQELSAAQRQALWFWTERGHRDRPEDWDLAVSRLRELGEHAAQVGVLLSLEMYEDTFLGTGESAVRLVQDIGSASVGLNPDIGNLIRLHRPIEAWRSLLEATLPYTNYWHVKNYSRTEDPARDLYVALPSTMEVGLIDYRTGIKMALEQGFQGVICTEHYGGDGLSVSATNRDYLRRHALPKSVDYALGSSRVRQVRGTAGGRS